MNTSRRRITHLFTIAATALLLFVGLAAPSGAVSEAPTADATTTAFADDLPEIGEVFDPGITSNGMCAEDWCVESDADGDDDDQGGRWGWTRLSNAFDSNEFYQVYFEPLGEQLYLWDSFSDGHQARADVVVTVPVSDVVVDRDSGLYTSYRTDFDLGTPDGSGDIAEGLNVSTRVCIAGTRICSEWVTGRA